jgi:hypothetical protein
LPAKGKTEKWTQESSTQISGAELSLLTPDSDFRKRYRHKWQVCFAAIIEQKRIAVIYVEI